MGEGVERAVPEVSGPRSDNGDMIARIAFLRPAMAACAVRLARGVLEHAHSGETTESKRARPWRARDFERLSSVVVQSNRPAACASMV
jgi:hypothetical protein